jgi:hypothetical protein
MMSFVDVLMGSVLIPSVSRRASSMRPDKSTRTCLNPAESRVSFRVLRPLWRRAGECEAPRDTGAFFWFVFFRAEENEQVCEK